VKCAAAHGGKRGLITTGIDIRQDLIGDQVAQKQWAERLRRTLREIEATLRMEAVI
jgi:predicted N-formylglutamate amidohydrolase